MSNLRMSRLASNCPKDFDFEYFVYSNEGQYKIWCSFKRIFLALRQIDNNTLWNTLICMLVLICLILVAADYSDIYFIVLDAAFNIIYAVHVLLTTLERVRQAHYEDFEFKWSTKLLLVLDVLSYLHYVGYFLSHDIHRIIKIVCYFVRLHTSFRFLWAITDTNLKGTIIGTALKYCFIFLVFRLFYSILWMHIPVFQHKWVESKSATTDDEELVGANVSRVRLVSKFNVTDDSTTSKFIRSAYLVNMMFLPIGSMVHPKNDYERIALLCVLMTGTFVMAGAAVASLALVLSLYMRPEEEFRTRFRLIMDEMKSTHVPKKLRDKVDTFYRMYWHKQKAISEAELLQIFPHTIPCTIYTDIYFEAQQKSPILCDLSYQFLWEVAKVMETTYYVPGDTIINRGSVKSSIIYITYGDVEMLTAEDDQTPILRMTRGSVISPCAGSPALACASAFVKIQAATFCSAHVLTAANLWRVALKYGKDNGQAFIILSSFEEHFERVKRHYKGRISFPVKYKSSILEFKRNLIALKEAKDEFGNHLLERTDFFLEISECYIMRNRADSSLTEDSDEICLRPTFPCVLQAQSSLLVAWNALVSIFIIIVSFVHPYRILYFRNVDLEFRFFDYMVTGLYSLDLFVHLSTGANVEEGVPITFKQTSTQQIQSYWFVLDVISTIPLFEFVGDGKFAGINKLLRLPRLFRMLKSMEDVCVYYSHLIRFMSYSLLMFILCYWIAALQQGYMCYLHDHCRVRNITHAPFWKRDVLTDKVRHRMFFGLYWAVSIITFTTHITSNWNTSDWRNLVYNSLLLESVAVLYTFMESMYSATIMVTTALKEDYDQTIANVKNFLIRSYVDPTLRYRFIRYLQLSWHTDKAYSMTQKKKSIFYDLPPHVYQDIVAKQRIKYLLCIPFMKYLNKEDHKEISAASKLFYTSPNEILLNTGDINNEIFIIKQGICEIYDPQTEQVVDTLLPKESFGVLECLLRFPAYYTVRAVTHVQIVTISRKSLADVLNMPRIKDAIEYVKREPDYLNVQTRHDPFLSYEIPPPTPNLARFPLLRKFEPDTDFLQPFMNLGFFSILRYVFPRYTIRPDGTYIYRYEWFRALCSLTASLMYPSYSYMVLQFPWLFTFLYFLDFCAYFDMVQRMMVGYYNDRGILVYHPASTAANYIKGPFLVDLLASLPMENLESARSDITESSESAYETVSFVKQLLMLNRLLQLYRLPGAMDILSQYFTREDILLVKMRHNKEHREHISRVNPTSFINSIKSIPLFMILVNVLTCFVVFSSVKIYILPADSSRESWERWKIVPFKDSGGSWIYLFRDNYRFNMTESPWNLQLTIYSWVVYEITTTGFNTFKPSNINLLRVLFFGMCAGCMMKTYFSVRIISIRANVNKMLASFQESMKDITIYMNKEKLSRHVQAKVLAYYEHNWNKTGGLDYRSVLKLCDQITLRTDAILHLYGHTFSKCPIIYHCDKSLLRVVGRSVHGVYFLAGTRIIQKDDVITDMYIVDYGTLDVKESKESHMSLAYLVRGSVFGNMENQESVRCPTDVITTSNVRLLQINAVVFHTIILDFPTVKVLMRKYRPNNENYILGRPGESISLTDWKRSQPPSTTKMNVNLTGMTKHFNINSTPAQYYLILVSILCVYGDIYNAGFQFNHVVMIACLYILDMCFYMKIIFHYILPFVVNEGEARDELIDTRKQYMKGEFKYDILSCLPIELLCFLFEKTEDKWKWLSILRLNRLLRMATINGCLTRHFARLSINLTISTVTLTLIWFSLFVHGMGCIWYAIGVFEDGNKNNSSWLHNNDGSDVCDNAYICSIYFILTTFIEKGVGDVLPKKQSEVVFTILLELISTMMYMIYVGEFSNIFQYQSFRSFAYYRKHLELQDFLNSNRVSKNLVSLVKKYSLHLWKESRGVQMPNFLEKAPPCFKLNIMSAAYMKHFVNHPAFRDCELAFLRQLVGCLQLYTYSPDIYVAKEGEITDCMYLVHRGSVQEIEEDMDQKMAEFNAGQSFGMVHGLIRNLPFNFSYKTVKKSEVLTLSLDSWEHLLRLFPKSRYEIFKNVPNHPYGKLPDDKDEQGLDFDEKTPPVISQSIPEKSLPEYELKETPPGEQLEPPGGIKPATATVDAGSEVTGMTAGTVAGLAAATGLVTAAGVAAMEVLIDESVEKDIVATKVDTQVISTTTVILPAPKEQKSKATVPEVTTSMKALTASHSLQDDEAVGTTKSLIMTDKSEGNTSESERKSESKYLDENGSENDTPQNNLFKRMTDTAKKIIGKDKKDKDSLQMEQGIKTSDVLNEYENKAVAQNDNSLLTQYIEKKEAEKAKKVAESQKNEFQDASRHSVVAFDDKQNKSERIVLTSDNSDSEQDEMYVAPLAPRRSVVVFGDKIFSENRENIKDEKEYYESKERNISQTTSTQAVKTGIEKEKETDEAVTSLHPTSYFDRPKVPQYLDKDEIKVENDFSGFPYPMRYKDSDDKIVFQQSKSKIMKENGEEEDKVETKSGKSVVGILEPQSEVVTDKSIDIWKLGNESETKRGETDKTEHLISDVKKSEINNEQLKPVFFNENKSDTSNVKKINQESIPIQKTAEVSWISNTEMPQTSKSATIKDKKATTLSQDVDESSPSSLEEYLDQTHKSKTKPTSGDKVVRKRKFDRDKGTEKRMSKVTYESDGSKISRSTDMESETRADDDPTEEQLSLTEIQHLMDSDGVSPRPAEKKDA